MDLQTEDEAKNEVMRMLFTVVFYGFTNPYVKRNFTNLNTPSFLWAAANCSTTFTLIPDLTTTTTVLQSLIGGQRPLLNLLEKRITCVTTSNHLDLSKQKHQIVLYVFHRLVDHGVANKLLIRSDCPVVLAWLLHGRGSQYEDPRLMKLMQTRKRSCESQDASPRTDVASCSTSLVGRVSGTPEDEARPCKYPRTSFVLTEEEEKSFDLDPQVLCQAFAPCDAHSAGACPRGQIDCLELSNCRSESLRVLNSALPTFFCLRSLILHSECKYYLWHTAVVTDG